MSASPVARRKELLARAAKGAQALLAEASVQGPLATSKRTLVATA